jgi:hypothetical protein
MKLFTMLAMVLFGGVVGSVNGATGLDPAGRADSVLAASKAAAGGAAWDKIDTLAIASTMHMPDGAGTFGNDVDLRTGRDRLYFQVGPMTGSLGWDGKAAWTVDPATGKAAIETSVLEIARRRSVAYADAYGFYFPSRMPAAKRYVGKKSAGGTSFDVIAITPAGGVPFALWINARTHLIDRQVSPSIDPPQTQFLSDYRLFHGVKLPYAARTVMTATGQEMYTSGVTSVAINGPFGDGKPELAGASGNR